MGMLAIRNEEYLSRKVLRDDIMRITDYYAEQGYAFADVRPNMDISESGSRVDISLTVDRPKA